ncbi:MAG: acyl carrier protein [Clostridia bacterium]|nr:acyl carrier protein [Clostridia bacterium]
MVFDKIKALIVEQFMINDPDTITMQTSFVDDLEADSLDIVELIMAVEEEFGVAIDDQDVDGVKTIGDVVNYISEKQGN